MEELLKAIQEKDCKRLASLLYYKVDELSEEDLKEVLERAEKLVLECKDYELYKLVVYYFLEFLNIDKIEEFEKLAEKEDSFEVKYHLADLYYLIGELEKALDLYRGLLEEETEKGNLENIAKIYYNMGLIHEELLEYEKALELMNKAEKVLDDLGKEEDVVQIGIHKAYITFEMGELSKAKAQLARILPQVLDNNRLRAQIHLVFEEIFEDKDNYEAALHECLYAMLHARDTEYFDVAFDSLIDVLWQMMMEDQFETVYNNMDMFTNVFEDMREFFEGVKAVALYKDGKIGREEVSEYITKIDDRRLLDLLEFLSEAEL
ncbi:MULTISPECIES: lipopolysaccharide assembly protein LapB [Thermococcus]|uniref:TRP-repeat-containing protein n=2 Tax=Thermococcus sibiricus TaxID=172049 RepID=C6A2P5_THESM|nr:MULTISPECIES: tetratricopeptide repeat protein [Thermococcus]KUK28156.1 MAG: TRP-repeat-containing protein [Thermococcus sp. 40_45]HII67315.1 tetratricopeptide repeat protein [Thermococcaceae archaeon]ACS89890.1 TRP-repeat-containing protein [Thermococcus sibiricus MM 739]KUK18258.1 MAG: TRP-repeat-containing protein [Thermococcus sibiricus]MBC7095101.1 tetratricopeptide repeat protein [Thermococcus sp.]